MFTVEDATQLSTHAKSITAAKVGREAPKYLLRLPPELRDRLQKEANLNGRSVNSEILNRLQRTLDQQETTRRAGYRIAGEAPPPEQLASSEGERAILAEFRRLAPEKQFALLSLLK